MSRARPLPLLAAAVASVALALTGCGGSSSSPSVAHISSGKGASSASGAAGGSSSESTASPEQAGLAYAKCMRADGVPSFPDPTPGGGLLFHASRGLISSPAFRAAQAKCQKLMPGGGPPSTTHPSAQTLARFLRIAQCMRKHGVSDFPDPRTSAPSLLSLGRGGGVISDIEEVIFVFPATIDQSSPVFTHAAAACAFPLHNH